MSYTNANKCVSCVYISELPCSGKCYRWNRYESKQPASVAAQPCGRFAYCNFREPAPVDGHDVPELLELLKRFYACWNRCESTRGCYACAEPHDCRCEKERGIPGAICTCGRDELEALEFAIDNINEPCEPLPTAQDVIGVLEDDELVEKVKSKFAEDNCQEALDLIDDFMVAYRAAVGEKLSKETSCK